MALARLGAYVVAVLALLFPSLAAAESVASPDGRIVLDVSVDGSGTVAYTISRDGKAVIARSTLGLQFSEGGPLRRDMRITGSSSYSGDETWEQPWGERRFVRDQHNGLVVQLEQTIGDNTRKMDINFRVFNGGVGFRYVFPEQSGWDTARITDELTEFNLADNGTAWWVPAGDWNRYEYIYSETAADAVPTAHSPISFRLNNGVHVALHEAALVDYSGMWIKRIEKLRFRAELAPSATGAKVVRDLPFATPWRTIRIADDAAGLYDNDIDLNLNEPNKLGDVSWFEPHKYIGIWWGMHLDTESWNTGPKHGANTENAKRYIDFAAKHGFRGVLIEGWNVGWDGPWFGNGRAFNFTRPTEDFDIAEITRYGLDKGVRLIGHHETGGNIKVYEEQLADAMAYYRELGIDAVKTGYVTDAGAIIAAGPDGGEQFVWHDGQRMVQHHLLAVKEAAKNRIAVNAHEPVKATGLRRTYPNWVSREGARGMEYQAWGEPKNPPEHVPTLVFTRMLSGPMDYTPGVLSLIGRGETRLQSTLARQLALYVVLYSPIQMAADLPENLAQYPRELEFISKVPADWQQSRTLLGEIGDHAVIARQDRNSKAWYIGGVTDSDARSLSVPLDFLDKGTRYTATIYRDGPNADGLGEDRHDIVIESRELGAEDALDISMARAGGFAISLEPVE
ncbi:glycoside hydrolase family 97 protein [Alterisphingorhabdus coralli]|uniref:Glycoside hydrolase family 97 protein n=1 Tax=Alterisphingorhabdus coralli TaxID=3071408 RepID=A0AA97F914_9SPHN|nr:glycoside hydrolase family 97 protein [Parasphingorhabdus sp. SCSIO 66989]WOE75518.1 glycoside hydrolase family 97 protein [Parasphingorhabdus sp. SCSIO 66989]